MPLAHSRVCREVKADVMRKKKSTRLSSKSKVNFTFRLVKTFLRPIPFVVKVIIEEMYPLRATYALHVHVHVHVNTHVHAHTYIQKWVGSDVLCIACCGIRVYPLLSNADYLMSFHSCYVCEYVCRSQVHDGY